MITIQRVYNSLKQYGLWATILKVYILIIDFCFDIKYGIGTRKLIKLNDLTIKSNNKERGANYQATRVIPLRKLFHKIQLMIPAGSVFVDFGCGKGRVLLIAAQFGFSQAIGVEFAHELCEIATHNCANYKAKTAVRTQFQIIETDVVDYPININENVFFMFNPFDEVVLGKVLKNITLSLKTLYRRILIIYYNPRYGNYIEKHEDFVKSGDYIYWGYNFTVYSNCESNPYQT